MKIIAGLGNPGKQYQSTRHNVGFRILDRIVQSCSSKFKVEKKFDAELAEGEINDEKVILVKPLTFMNKSGEAVGEIYRFYKDRMTISDIFVVHDDSDLELGRIKIQKGGGSAGHHGIESIIKAVGNDFVRIRIGVRVEEGKAMDFILKPFNKEQEKVLNGVLDKAVEVIFFILEAGVEKGMNKYNVNGVI